MDFSKETLLVIAPHADDEILGCFKLIKKIKEQGGKTFVLIISMDSYEKISMIPFRCGGGDEHIGILNSILDSNGSIRSQDRLDKKLLIAAKLGLSGNKEPHPKHDAC